MQFKMVLQNNTVLNARRYSQNPCSYSMIHLNTLHVVAEETNAVNNLFISKALKTTSSGNCSS